MEAQVTEEEKESKMQNECYATGNFYLSAYLIAIGLTLKGYRKTKEGLTLFIFSNSDKLFKHVNKYYSPQGYVKAVEYGNAMRTLKGIIHKPDLKYAEENNTINKNERI